MRFGAWLGPSSETWPIGTIRLRNALSDWWSFHWIIAFRSRALRKLNLESRYYMWLWLFCLGSTIGVVKVNSTESIPRSDRKMKFRVHLLPIERYGWCQLFAIMVFSFSRKWSRSQKSSRPFAGHEEVFESGIVANDGSGGKFHRCVITLDVIIVVALFTGFINKFVQLF